MPFAGTRKLVVLGFGPIGSGLFVYEAGQTGDYAPPLVVDVRADLIAGLRADGGHYRLNIARADRVDVAEVGPVDVADSSIDAERDRAVEAIAAADEFASALPSVAFYRSDAPNSPHALLAEALLRRTLPDPLIVFCAENHRSAATLLEEAVLEAVPAGERDGVRGRARYVDTVIGKMSGLITDAAEIDGPPTRDDHGRTAHGLPGRGVRPHPRRAARSGGALHPGMPVLREVDDLAPFEDAKLLGHNATHALGAFLGQLLGLSLFADLREVPGAMEFLRTAFVEESGAVLRARWAGTDELFTEAGYADFADDLLARMVNPHLADTIERAARDPRRKLGWEDRLVGLIRLGLAQGIPTPRYAMGVAAGLDISRRSAEGPGSDADLLLAVWPSELDSDEVEAVLDVVEEGREWLGVWHAHGFALV